MKAIAKRISLIIIVILILSLSAFAVPQLINYQGSLSDSSGPVNGDVSITFTIYNASTAGDVLWYEIQTVTVTDGVFNVLLGSQTPFPTDLFSGDERYLGVRVETDPEMAPRQRLTSVPFALGAPPVCSPGDFVNCYTGPNGTLGIGECKTGERICNPSGTGFFGSCENEVTPLEDICDGLDNDCNPATPDGSEEPTLGVPCDGPDSDLCLEGTKYCSGGTLGCTDNTGGTLDVCNGGDDDCDPSSADGSDETWLDTPCDGPDTDLCEEGTYVCSAGAQTCSDSTGDTVEICDGLDNNCDAWIDEGCMCIEFDTQSCYSGPVATFNIGECTSGTQTCIAEDVWGACEGEVVPSAEACDGLDNNCDGQVDEGC